MQHLDGNLPLVMLAVPCEMTTDEAQCLAESCLQPDELASVARFGSAKDRHAALISLCLLRLGLSTRFEVPPREWRFVRQLNRKPVVDSPLGLPVFDFSLSRTEGMIAFLVAGSSMAGVDVENCRRTDDLTGVANATLAASELEALASFSGETWTRKFLELWTLKEAYAKAIGRGLSQPFQALCFNVDQAKNVAMISSGAVDDEAEGWRFSTSNAGSSHVLATAIRADEKIPQNTLSICKVRLSSTGNAPKLDFTLLE